MKATQGMNGRALLLAAGISTALLTAGPVRDAHACGGFFCSQVPVDQSGEQIVFSLEPGKITAHIQIAYKGEAKDFAWVLPVMATPTISLSSPSVFQALAQRTTPQFQVNFDTTGGFCFNRRLAEDAAGAPTAANGGVQVLDAREVGPYETVVLSSRNADELVKWLTANGFDQPASSTPLIKHYVDGGFLFVALKLKKDASVGEIQPVAIEQPVAEPCVPLVLTQVAAVRDMPVMVYALASARAIPTNWFNVEIELAKINWLRFGDNYQKVLTDAIDEAAGHGFVTEYAGKSSIMKNALYRVGQWDTTQLQSITDPAALLDALLRMGYPRDSIMQSLLRQFIPMPAAVAARGVDERSFYNNIRQYQADLVGFVLDIKGFIAALNERVIDPIKKAQAMFDTQPYLTRLYSTVSPDEMNRDPLFDVNPDLPEVSNIHTAKAYGMCNADGSISNLRLELPDGQIISIAGPVNPYTSEYKWTFGADRPAAKTITLFGPRGEGTVYKAQQIATIDRALDTMPAETVRKTMPPVGVVPPQNTSSDGCSVAGSTGGVSAALMVLFAALLSRRRRNG